MTDYRSVYQDSHALIIGINTYSDPRFVPLGMAESDADALAAVLSAPPYNFQITRLSGGEATKSAILQALFKLRRTKPDDRILFYFAGHGYTLSDRLGNETGYLACADTVPEQDFTALSLEEVTNLTLHSESKHIGFVFDACFSGQALGLTRAASVAADKYMLRRAYQVISAGAGDQTVSDFSSMTGSLINALECGVLVKDGLATMSELGLYLQQTITADSNQTQIPQFGHLRGSQGGDFVFYMDTSLRLPGELEDALRSTSAAIRQGAITDLITMAKANEGDLALLARERLAEVVQDDQSEAVRTAARAYFVEIDPEHSGEEALKQANAARKEREKTRPVSTPPIFAHSEATTERALPPDYARRSRQPSSPAWLAKLNAILPFKLTTQSAGMFGAGIVLLLVLTIGGSAMLFGGGPRDATPTPAITTEPTDAPTESPNADATATEVRANVIADIKNAARAYDRVVRRALETLNSEDLTTVARGNALNDRLDAIEFLRDAGNCKWVYDHRGMTVDDPVFLSDTRAEVIAILDRDGRVVCDDGEAADQAFKGPVTVKYTLSLIEDQWFVVESETLEVGEGEVE